VDVRFVTSAAGLAQRPERVLPEIAFVGRSNCGKSSLLNHYLGRRDLARTSGKPGKTRLLNYFLVDDRYYLVDLPGYGYARVSKALRAEWRELFRRYIGAQDRPLAVFQLLDVRHRPSAEDREVNGWLAASGHPFGLVATKIDKVGANARAARYEEIIRVLDVPRDTPFFPTSARLGAGREEMAAWVEALLAAAEGGDEDHGRVRPD
jgi:GTP-binding protein